MELQRARPRQRRSSGCRFHLGGLRARLGRILARSPRFFLAQFLDLVVDLVGEAAVLIGAFAHSAWLGVIVVPGAMIAAAYMLRLGLKLAYGYLLGRCL